MGKLFEKYYSESGTIPYRASTLCFCLTQYAKNYICSERKVITGIDSKIRDAVLVDSINYLGSVGCCDFGLYTDGLYEDKVHNEEVDAQCLLTVLINHYASYMFREGIVESVLRNNHMNECDKEFDANDGAMVLVDFINYIAEVNDYDRTFTVRELYQENAEKNHERDMMQLRDFLQLTSNYGVLLQDGIEVEFLYESLTKENKLKYVSRRGKYHSTLEKSTSNFVELSYYHKKNFENDLYALAYAYDKLDGDKTTENEVIKKKILEMKKK